MSDVKVVDNSKEIKALSEDKIKKILYMWGLTLQKEAINQITENRSVVTGNLRASISFAVGDKAVIVGTNVYYGKHVEFGHSKRRAKPFIQPSFERAKVELQNIATEMLKGD